MRWHKAMRSGSSALLLAGIAGALGFSAAPVHAQEDVRAATGGKIEEITVTARRREESMQEVPIAVTAYSAEDLRESNVVRIENLGQVVAGLTVSTTNSRNNVPAFAIRGQRNDAAFITNDPSVGIYVAEAVQARVFGLAQSLFDLESVQVLKGPQGTLFGRNTTGGAILFQPQRPTLGQFEGYVQGRAGDYGRADAQGAVSIPLGDSAAVRFAVNRTHRDGYVKNVFTGQELNEEDTISGRMVLLTQPTDAFVNTLYVDYFDADQAGSGTRLTDVNPTGGAQTRYGLLDDLARQNATFDFHQVEGQRRAVSTGKNFGVTNVTEVDLSDSLLLKSILNYRDIDMVEIQDLEGSNYPVIETDDRQQTEQYSAELQLQGTSFSDRLEWIVGAFYFREDGDRQTLTTALGGTPAPRFGKSVSESKSIFTQGDYALTDALTLTLGWRYNWDEREFEQTLLSPTTGLCTFCAKRDAEFTSPTYTASLSWQIDDYRLLYVATRRGYRSGGFNSSGNNAPALEPFAPEDVVDYEIGFKGDFFIGDTHLRTNFAVYHSDYEDIQRTIIGQVNGVPVTSIFNAASATINGAEAEITFAPLDGLELIATATWTDPDYDEFFEQTAAGPVDRSMNEFAFIPEFTYRAAVRARLPFAAGTGSETWLRADYMWQDDIYHTEFNNPRNFQKGYGLLTARLDFQNVFDSGVDVGLWGTNLTDEEYFTSTGDQFSGVGVVYRGLSEPRMWGIDVRYSF